MVAKTVKQLCQLGYLEQLDDVGKQKIIFTKAGENLMSDARQPLADLDKTMQQQLTDIDIEKAITELEAMIEVVEKIKNTPSTLQ